MADCLCVMLCWVGSAALTGTLWWSARSKKQCTLGYWRRSSLVLGLEDSREDILSDLRVSLRVGVRVGEVNVVSKMA